MSPYLPFGLLWFYILLIFASLIGGTSNQRKHGNDPYYGAVVGYGIMALGSTTIGILMLLGVLNVPFWITMLIIVVGIAYAFFWALVYFLGKKTVD